MKTIEEWINYYIQMDLEVEPYNSQDLTKAIGIRAIVGSKDLKVLKFMGMKKNSSYYKDVLVKSILDLLMLSENYPWVTCTSDTICIWFKCSYKGKIYNDLPLLWDTKEVLPATLPSISFHKSVPKCKPMYIDYDLVLHCIDVYKDKLPIHDSILPEDLNVDACVEIWSLKEFVEINGPRIEFGGYPYYSHMGEFYPVCRIGDNGRWKYAYISLRMRYVNAAIIAERQETLRVGKLPTNTYVLFDTGSLSWQEVIL